MAAYAATEPEMKSKNLFVIPLLLAVFFTIGVTVFSAGARPQEDSWQVLRADYGFRAQRTDVTDLLRDLLSRGGANGRVTVNNQTMGGDPAVGKDKSLRIFARNRQGQEREFEFNEGSFVDVRMFFAHRDDLDDRPTDRPGNYADHDRDDRNGLVILRAFYGVQRRTVNVTDLLRDRIREGGLNFRVENAALGGDPAVGADKLLIVVYRFRGQETAAAVPEGGVLTLP